MQLLFKSFYHNKIDTEPETHSTACDIQTLCNSVPGDFRIIVYTKDSSPELHISNIQILI